MSTPPESPEPQPTTAPSSSAPADQPSSDDDPAALRAEVDRLRRELDARRQAEATRTQRILESITDAFFALDAEWRFTYVNAQAGPLLEREPAELLGRKIWEEFPEAVGTQFYEAYHRAVGSGEPVSFAAHYPPLRRWFEVSAYPVEGGGLSVFFDDVSDRHAAHEAVRQSEARFRFLADTLPQMVWTTHPDGSHDHFNRRWYEFTGVDEGDTDGWGWADILHPDDYDRTIVAWRHSLETGTPYEIEYRFRRHDGVYRWQLGRALPRRDEDGRIVQWVGTCTDIHDHRLTLAALRESEAQFDRLVESGLLGVFFFALDGRILNPNGAFLSMLGMTPADVPEGGLSWASITPDEAQDADAAQQLDLERNAVVKPYEKVLHRRDGGRTHAVIGAALIEGSGEYDGIAFALDITRRKANEQKLERLTAHLEERVRVRTRELARANRVLENRNRELQDFAYVASHDLQEPLRKIRAFTDVVLDDYADAVDEEGRFYLGRIQDAAERMSTLIVDLLSFSRIATQAGAFEPVDLDEILAHVLSDLEVRIRETDGVVEADALPTIEADATQLRQLLQNLIGNALKFHRPGVPPHVRLHAGIEKPEERDAPSMLRLEVSDNGIGFDTKFADRIFAPFQRLHTRDKYEGTGIGLAICRRIVERHGGTIAVESAPDQGAVFTIHLPVRQPRDEASREDA